MATAILFKVVAFGHWSELL